MDEKKDVLMTGAKVQMVYGWKTDLIQVLMCIVANSALLSSGMTLGFTSIALPFMEEPNDVLNVTLTQSSWIASLATISTPVGCLLSGPLLDSLGRKFGLLIINIPAVIGWLFIAIKPSLLFMYIGRFLTGLACGLSSIPATVYIAESSTASLRGYLVTGTSIGISLGVAIVYTMGLCLQENWRMVAILCAICPVVAAILIAIFIPESPLWLLTHGKPEKAKQSLMILRATKNPDDIQQELEDMEQQTRKNKKKPSTLNALKALRKPESYKPLLIMNGFFLFQQLTGTFVVIFYAVAVVHEAGVTTDPFVVAVLIGITRLIFTIVAAWMSRKFGRRPTALISGTGMTISLMVLATHLFIQHQQADLVRSIEVTNNETLNLTAEIDNNPPERPPSFLPMISILIYIMSSTIGFLTLPWAMIGEVFPVQIRGVASGFTTSMTYIFSFIAVKLFPYMMEVMQKHGVFYFYGVMALYGTVFLFFFLPETQGKTLAEIESHFAGRRRPRGNTDEEEALSGTKMVTIVRAQEKK